MFVTSDDNRFFARMDVECVVRFKVNGDQNLFHGHLENLSAEGLSFSTDQPLNQDTKLFIEVAPGNESISPLMANAKVLRCNSSEQGNYQVCCEMQICA